MITLDCILHNTDRHEKNFGYLIDSNKNCSFVPLFDNGFCLGTNRVANDYVNKVYEIAKAEIQFSTKTLAQLKSEVFVEVELDINM